MPDPNLLAICGTAFSAVFVLLVVMALAIRVITAALPAPEVEEEDVTVAAAIATTVAAIYPGARVTRIEEDA